jgi:putative membrane protein
MRITFLPALACTPGQTERRGDASESGMADSANVSTNPADTATSGTPTGANTAGLEGIFSRLELANTAEIETSRLGVSKAQSPKVKQIAQQLVTHHTQNRTELEALAKKKGITPLDRAGGSTTRDTSGTLALKGLDGAAFDSAFVAAQIEAHQANLDAIRNQMLPSTQDPEVRQFLEKTQTAMQKHLTSLRQAQGRSTS